MTNYQRGASIELRAVKQLRALGYHATRSARSSGFADVIAVNAQHVLFVQCKYGGSARWTPQRIARLLASVPRLPRTARFELWIWHARSGFEIIRAQPEPKGDPSFMQCKNCGKEFDPADRVSPSANEGALANVRYCSEKCDRQWNNRETYKRHKQSILARVLKNQRRAQKGKK